MSPSSLGSSTCPRRTIQTDLEQLEALGLVLARLDEGFAPRLLAAGRQFLARRGHVEHDILRFLPRTIDDLNAREALLVAGTILVDEFRRRWSTAIPSTMRGRWFLAHLPPQSTGDWQLTCSPPPSLSWLVSRTERQRGASPRSSCPSV
jgi:hypothetical protein